MQFDPKPFIDASVNGVPIFFVVMALVFAAKEFGAGGKLLKGLALGIGLALGVLYQLSVNGVPGNFAGWFADAIFGIGLGGLAMKSYDLAGSLVDKAVAALIKQVGGGPGELG